MPWRREQIQDWTETAEPFHKNYPCRCILERLLASSTTIELECVHTCSAGTTYVLFSVCKGLGWYGLDIWSMYLASAGAGILLGPELLVSESSLSDSAAES